MSRLLWLIVDSVVHALETELQLAKFRDAPVRQIVESHKAFLAVSKGGAPERLDVGLHYLKLDSTPMREIPRERLPGILREPGNDRGIMSVAVLLSSVDTTGLIAPFARHVKEMIGRAYRGCLEQDISDISEVVALAFMEGKTLGPEEFESLTT